MKEVELKEQRAMLETEVFAAEAAHDERRLLAALGVREDLDGDDRHDREILARDMRQDSEGEGGGGEEDGDTFNTAGDASAYQRTGSWDMDEDGSMGSRLSTQRARNSGNHRSNLHRWPSEGGSLTSTHEELDVETASDRSSGSGSGGSTAGAAGQRNSQKRRRSNFMRMSTMRDDGSQGSRTRRGMGPRSSTCAFTEEEEAISNAFGGSGESWASGHTRAPTKDKAGSRGSVRTSNFSVAGLAGSAARHVRIASSTSPRHGLGLGQEATPRGGKGVAGGAGGSRISSLLPGGPNSIFVSSPSMRTVKKYTEDDLKRMAAKYRVDMFEIRDWLEEFLRYDDDGYGTLSRPQFLRAIRSRLDLDEEVELPSPVMREVRLTNLDGDEDRPIDFEEYVVWSLTVAFSENLKILSSNERKLRQLSQDYDISIPDLEVIWAQYHKFDKDSTGDLSKTEFQCLLRLLMNSKETYDVPKLRLDRFWVDADLDKDGIINFEEFLVWYLKYFSVRHDCNIETSVYAKLASFRASALLQH